MSHVMSANSLPTTPAGNRQISGRRGMLYIVSAPSGAGKTTLCKQIVTSVPTIWHSVSFTTRSPRADEKHGSDYHFVDEQVFQGMVSQNEFLEHAHVHGHWYGTPRKPLVDKMEEGVDVLLEIDVQGALQLKKLCNDAVYIFIVPPSLDVLRARLQSRGSDSQEEIARRLKKAKEEIWCFRNYDYIVCNDDLARSLPDLQRIFVAERLKTKRVDMRWFEQNFMLDEKQESVVGEPSITST